MPVLHPGDTFPSITVKLPGGETLDLPRFFGWALQCDPVLPGLMVSLLQCPAARLSAGWCQPRRNGRQGRRPLSR